jgi:hypothetical protein
MENKPNITSGPDVTMGKSNEDQKLTGYIPVVITGKASALIPVVHFGTAGLKVK